MLLKLQNAESKKVVYVEQTLGKRQVFGWFSRIRSGVTFAEHAKHLGCQSHKQKIQKCELCTQTSFLKQNNHHQLHCTYVRNSTSVCSDHSGRQSIPRQTSTTFTPCLLCSCMWIYWQKQDGYHPTPSLFTRFSAITYVLSQTRNGINGKEI